MIHIASFFATGTYVAKTQAFRDYETNNMTNLFVYVVQKYIPNPSLWKLILEN
jgi:hypothetical protein